VAGHTLSSKSYGHAGTEQLRVAQETRNDLRNHMKEIGRTIRSAPMSRIRPQRMAEGHWLKGIKWPNCSISWLRNRPRQHEKELLPRAKWSRSNDCGRRVRLPPPSFTCTATSTMGDGVPGRQEQLQRLSCCDGRRSQRQRLPIRELLPARFLPRRRHSGTRVSHAEVYP